MVLAAALEELVVASEVLAAELVELAVASEELEAALEALAEVDLVVKRHIKRYVVLFNIL